MGRGAVGHLRALRSELYANGWSVNKSLFCHCFWQNHCLKYFAVLDQQNCWFLLQTKARKSPIQGSRKIFTFNITGHEKEERNLQVGKTVSPHVCGSGDLKKGAWPGRVLWNHEYPQFKCPLWGPHGNSGLALERGQSDMWVS